MTIFPDALENSAVTSADVVPAAEIAASFIYDADNKIFRLLDGTPEECQGADAVRAWINLMLRVEKNTAEVFDGLQTAPGIDRDALLGRRELPEGYQRSEIMREIRDTLALNPGILSADGFNFSRAGRALRVKFNVRLRTNESMEVIEDVG